MIGSLINQNQNIKSKRNDLSSVKNQNLYYYYESTSMHLEKKYIKSIPTHEETTAE